MYSKRIVGWCSLSINMFFGVLMIECLVINTNINTVNSLKLYAIAGVANLEEGKRLGGHLSGLRRLTSTEYYDLPGPPGIFLYFN